jgi:phosphodiesterase/alkaline phosphatase D-like protein
MGLRVGEERRPTAIVWTRITAAAKPNRQGRPPSVKESPTRAFVENDPTPIAERRRHAGRGGRSAARLARHADLRDADTTAWRQVEAASDFTQQFPLRGLSPATRYYLRIAARQGEARTATEIGSFATAAAADQWQDVRFAVSSCQIYSHRDDRQGFQIYPAMGKLEPHFRRTESE